MKGELAVDARKANGVTFKFQRFWRALVLSATFLACPFVVCAQESQAVDLIAPSGLAAENLNRVAASAAQIEELLRKDPGLLVELKRWVAKEATDRGQILDDPELNEQAIFERLARDLEFRSVATRLLQRYAYSTPTLKPDSDSAREHEVLVNERRRRLAPAAAEESPAVEEKTTKPELKRTESCGGWREAAP